MSCVGLNVSGLKSDGLWNLYCGAWHISFLFPLMFKEIWRKCSFVFVDTRHLHHHWKISSSRTYYFL